MIFKGRTASPPPKREWAGGPYVPSLALMHCEKFATMVGSLRGTALLEPRHMLAGVYVASVEFTWLCEYWKNWSVFEGLVCEECGRLGPRLDYWLAMPDPKKVSKKGIYLPYGRKTPSVELEHAYSMARETAKLWRASEEPPILIPEDLLWSIASQSEFQISGRLARSSLDLDRVEQAIRSPTRRMK